MRHYQAGGLGLDGLLKKENKPIRRYQGINHTQLGPLPSKNTVRTFDERGASNSSVRAPTCANAKLKIPSAQYALYNILFTAFEDIESRSAKDTLIFDCLVYMATIQSGGVDLTEFIVTANNIANQVQSSNVSISQLTTIWQQEWASLATSVYTEAVTTSTNGDVNGAASLYMRAATYFQLAERFMDHRSKEALAIYKQSVASFNQAVAVPSPYWVPCTPWFIPYSGAPNGLHAYWCPAQGEPTNITVIALNGYDGSNLNSYHEVGVPSVRRGMNALIFEGPGQGGTARFEKLYFRPDYEVVVSVLLEWLETSQYAAAIDFSRVVLWGRSFGGYLAPRAFSGIPSLKGLVSDGGVYDFYQNGYCSLPPELQQALATNTTYFDETLSTGTKYQLPLESFLSFGYLGFNVTTPSELFLAWQDYWMQGRMATVADRPILVNSPKFDTLTGNQSAIFWSELPTINNQSVYLQLDPMRGNGLHCDVGSTANTINAILRWIQETI